MISAAFLLNPLRAKKWNISNLQQKKLSLCFSKQHDYWPNYHFSKKPRTSFVLH